MAVAVEVPRVCARPRSRLWQGALYWHLLSLDAPTVAVLWAWSFERAAGARNSTSALAVLGLGTWLIYVADRLLDARPTRGASKLRERHFFHARHRQTLLTVIWPVAALLLCLITRMPAIDRRDDAILFTVAMLYFASVHLVFPHARRWFAREILVGVVFALATAVPAWSGVYGSKAHFELAVVLFAALCCLNTIAIEVWEQDDGRRFSVSLAAGALILCSLALAFSTGKHESTFGSVAVCAGLSATLLFCLDSLHRRRSALESAPEDTASWLLIMRVAADAALLTPLLFVVPWR